MLDPKKVKIAMGPDDKDYAVSFAVPVDSEGIYMIIERAIGENCAKLVKDGDTLQLGIGAIPDAVLMFLGDKKDPGIHSEM